MLDSPTDRIAREAARLLGLGLADSIEAAIEAAAAEHAAEPGAPRPGHKAVRDHVRGMAMQALGREGYEESVRVVWRIAEELMTTVEASIDDATTLLCGRAAKGQIDGGVTLHVRVYTRATIGEIVDRLCGHGYDEPDFETGHTRFGRLDRARLTEDGYTIVITRCPTDPGTRLSPTRDADRDLFEGRPIATATLAALRSRLGS